MNIILIISDTFRYDNLFERAAMPVRTPELDNFAQRAVSLSHLYTGSFPTIPHRTDLTSGRFSWVRHPWQDRRLSSPNHLPVILRQHGYVSQLLCDCPHLFPAAFNVGFDAAFATRGQEADIPFLRMNYPIASTMPPEKTRQDYHFLGHNLVDLSQWTNQRWYREADRFPPRTASLAIEWLEENYQYEPFFLWVDFFDPHEPWDAPEYLVRRYDPDYHGTPMLHPNYGYASDLAPDELRNLRAHYCAEAELVDRWVGRVLQKIDDLDLWRNSIVVFTTDHGMSLGEHNRTGKSNINKGDPRCWPIYPEVAHIPLMVAAPGLQGGTTVDALIQPPDILPTMLDLAELQPATGEPLQGRSFAPLLRGSAMQATRDCAVSASFLRPAAGAQTTKWTTPMLYTRDWAYAPIGPNGERQLFDMRADPYAAVNVAEDYPQVVTELHDRFMSWLAEVDAPPEAGEVFTR